MSERDREFMRGQLASVGIFLEKSVETSLPPALVATPTVPDVDRDFIRDAWDGEQQLEDNGVSYRIERLRRR